MRGQYHLSNDSASINVVPEAVECVLPVDIVGKVVHLDWIPLQVGLGIALQPVHNQLMHTTQLTSQIDR